jgi:hypothetical protein
MGGWLRGGFGGPDTSFNTPQASLVETCTLILEGRQGLVCRVIKVPNQFQRTKIWK